jgi:hypothetical protein
MPARFVFDVLALLVGFSVGLGQLLQWSRCQLQLLVRALSTRIRLRTDAALHLNGE